MLKIILIEDPRLRRDLLADLQPDRDCLLVPDIKTKLSAEKFLLQNRLRLPGASVLRIQEFFKELFYQLPPKKELVSDLFFAELFAGFAQSHPDPFAQNLQNSPQFLSFFSRFLPILLHPQGSELMEEWFQAKGRSAAARWKPWLLLARDFFQHAVQRRSLIHESGVKGLLSHEASSLSSPPLGGRKITADLGMSCDPCEQFILKELSRKAEVRLLIPRLRQPEFFSSAEDIYSQILSAAPPQAVSLYGGAPGGPARQPSESSKKEGPVFFRKTCLSQLEEARTAAAMARAWLERGVREKDIAILAPDMEIYWPCLKPHLNREGIRAEKSSFSRFQDFPAARHWLAAMRIHQSSFRFSDLEHYSFYKRPRADFAEFQKLYFEVPERELSKKLIASPRMTRDKSKKARGREFIEWALSFWPPPPDSALESSGSRGLADSLDMALKALQSLPPEGELSWGAWLRLLEKTAASLKKETIRETHEGISCLSFNAIHSADGSHIIIMGLDEDSLKPPIPPALAWEDRQSLVSDLGFHLPFPHPEETVRGLLYLLQSSRLEEAVFAFAKTDFLGREQNPSLFFASLEGLLPVSELPPRRLTVWESQKRQDTIEGILAGSPKEGGPAPAKSLKAALAKSPKPFFQKEAIRLSAGRLQYCSDCGFRYAAKYIFGAEREPSVGRDLSPLAFGGLIHECFGEFLREGRSLDSSEKEIEEFVERFRPEEKLLAREGQWPVVKSSLISLMMRFLEKEKARRAGAAPSYRPFGMEKEINAFWNKKTGQLERGGDYPFSGRLDRADRSGEDGSYFLIDYKLSDSNSLTNIKSWMTEAKNNLQLSLYAHALEKGLAEDMPAAPVKALAYYSCKDFVFKGYVEKGSCLEDNFGRRSSARQGEEALREAIEAACRQVQETVESIERGEFFARPRDPKTCAKCFARRWCRAPHLG